MDTTVAAWNQTNQLLVKEHVGMFKAANNSDIFDLADGAELMQCREPSLGFLTKMLRFTDYKRMTPFDVHVTDASGKTIVRVRRGISLFLSKVRVYDEDDRLIGGFKQKLFTIGGGFRVLDPNDQVVCELKGKWTGWDFRFLAEGIELAHVTKKWAGIGKELFSSADNYVLAIADSVPADSDTRKLILAAVMCIDMVLKE
jgi:uncharacterized protein YxjI